MNNQIEEHRIRIKKYLELENVCLLTGAGTSYHLGLTTIRTIPDELKKICDTEIYEYFGDNANPSYEDLFNCLQADRYIKSKKGDDTNIIDLSIAKMQKWLLKNCCTTNSTIRPEYKDDHKLLQNRYHYHEMLIKKILQRPINLKRVSLFTTNYDMAFDYALDNLGVSYINGFAGVHNRCFRPEVYEYDLYYPGDSVAGKVHRAEKVLRYFKIHGSLSWVFTEPTMSNTYGIKEVSLNEKKPLDEGNEIVIYPCVGKKSFTLDLPYAELFRQFSQAINKPQSVLFCIGYSFYDEHINDIIKQALSIPSFALFIVNYATTPSSEDSEIGKLKLLNDKRIIVLDETDSELSSFTQFVENIMPDLYEEEENEIIAKTMNTLHKYNSDLSASNMGEYDYES